MQVRGPNRRNLLRTPIGPIRGRVRVYVGGWGPSPCFSKQCAPARATLQSAAVPSPSPSPPPSRSVHSLPVVAAAPHPGLAIGDDGSRVNVAGRDLPTSGTQQCSAAGQGNGHVMGLPCTGVGKTPYTSATRLTSARLHTRHGVCACPCLDLAMGWSGLVWSVHAALLGPPPSCAAAPACPAYHTTMAAAGLPLAATASSVPRRQVCAGPCRHGHGAHSWGPGRAAHHAPYTLCNNIHTHAPARPAGPIRP